MASLITGAGSTADRPGPATRILPRRPGRLTLLVVAAAPMSAAISTVVHVGPALRDAALFVHLVSLVTGFGSVLAVDWHGTLWLLGRASLSEVVTLSERLAVPIWAGFGGLVERHAARAGHVRATDPRQARARHRPRGQRPVGGAAGPPARRGARRGAGALLVRGLLAATVSQACWWTATVIGFSNARS